MGIEPGWRFLTEEVVVAEVRAKAAGREMAPSKRHRGDRNIFKPGTVVISRFPLIKNVLIAGYELLYERNAAYTVCNGMVHDKGKKSALWRPYEEDLKGNVSREVYGERNVIVHIVIDCLLNREIRIRKCNLLYDVFAPRLCVFPSVTEPALVRRVVVD
jgi:hypothetical protein